MTSVSLQPVPRLYKLNSIFFHISEPNEGTKGPENHSLG
jgi:hypothetical protein